MSAAADSGRIRRRFEALRAEGRSGLVTFVTAGDPDPETSLELIKGLPGAGADLIELHDLISDILETAAGETYLLDLHTTSGESAPFATVGDTLRRLRSRRPKDAALLTDLVRSVEVPRL